MSSPGYSTVATTTNHIPSQPINTTSNRHNNILNTTTTIYNTENSIVNNNNINNNNNSLTNNNNNSIEVDNPSSPFTQDDTLITKETIEWATLMASTPTLPQLPTSPLLSLSTIAAVASAVGLNLETLVLTLSNSNLKNQLQLQQQQQGNSTSNQPNTTTTTTTTTSPVFLSSDYQALSQSTGGSKMASLSESYNSNYFFNLDSYSNIQPSINGSTGINQQILNSLGLALQNQNNTNSNNNNNNTTSTTTNNTNNDNNNLIVSFSNYGNTSNNSINHYFSNNNNNNNNNNNSNGINSSSPFNNSNGISSTLGLLQDNNQIIQCKWSKCELKFETLTDFWIHFRTEHFKNKATNSLINSSQTTFFNTSVVCEWDCCAQTIKDFHSLMGHIKFTHLLNPYDTMSTSRSSFSKRKKLSQLIESWRDVNSNNNVLNKSNGENSNTLQQQTQQQQQLNGLKESYLSSFLQRSQPKGLQFNEEYGNALLSQLLLQNTGLLDQLQQQQQLNGLKESFSHLNPYDQQQQQQNDHPSRKYSIDSVMNQQQHPNDTESMDDDGDSDEQLIYHGDKKSIKRKKNQAELLIDTRDSSLINTTTTTTTNNNNNNNNTKFSQNGGDTNGLVLASTTATSSMALTMLKPSKKPRKRKNDAPLGPFECKWGDCKDAMFDTLKELGDHIEEHVKTQRGKKSESMCEWQGCSRTDKPLKSAYNLIHHIRYKHTGEKPFSCDFPECDSKFVQLSDLNEHKRNIHKFDDGYVKKKRSNKSTLPKPPKETKKSKKLKEQQAVVAFLQQQQQQQQLQQLQQQNSNLDLTYLFEQQHNNNNNHSNNNQHQHLNNNNVYSQQPMNSSSDDEIIQQVDSYSMDTDRGDHSHYHHHDGVEVDMVHEEGPLLKKETMDDQDVILKDGDHNIQTPIKTSIYSLLPPFPGDSNGTTGNADMDGNNISLRTSSSRINIRGLNRSTNGLTSSGNDIINSESYFSPTSPSSLKLSTNASPTPSPLKRNSFGGSSSRGILFTPASPSIESKLPSIFTSLETISNIQPTIMHQPLNLSNEVFSSFVVDASSDGTENTSNTTTSTTTTVSSSASSTPSRRNSSNLHQSPSNSKLNEQRIPLSPRYPLPPITISSSTNNNNTVDQKSNDKMVSDDSNNQPTTTLTTTATTSNTLTVDGKHNLKRSTSLVADEDGSIRSLEIDDDEMGESSV